MSPKKVAVKAKTTKTTKKTDPVDITSPFAGDAFVGEDGQKLTLITKAGLEKLIAELEQLKGPKRKEVAAKIKEAISYGDLSENSEYEEAKNEQAFIEGRIIILEDKIKHAKIIKESSSLQTVQLGTTVHLQNLTKKSDDVDIFTIVGSTEADPFEGRISNESPVGSVLLDKRKGDVVKARVPAGSVEYKIIKLV